MGDAAGATATWQPERLNQHQTPARRHVDPNWPQAADIETVGRLRDFLLSLGLTDRPLADLALVGAHAADPRVRAEASRELALWHLRRGTTDGAARALDHVDAARRDAVQSDFATKLVTIELVALFLLGRPSEAREAFETACAQGTFSTDTALAWANFAPAAPGRVAIVNAAMDHHGLPPISLGGGAHARPYDRLAVSQRLRPVEAPDIPKVTVLVAAYNAQDTIGTAIRALQAQTWRNLEILVLDDCSTDATPDVVRRICGEDSRVRLLRMPSNAGAYGARNRGLDAATGDFVTLHDADDWSHPWKIERQARFLADAPSAVACFSEQARATPELRFLRWTGRGQFLIRNVSSFMFRRPPVMDKLGYWDNVRVAADMEFVRRAETVFGRHAVVDLPTGPMSFQRDSRTSAIADDVLGMNGFYYGARREYVDAQLHHHETAGSLRYAREPAIRPFPAPAPMLQRDPPKRRFDVAVVGDFRLPGLALHTALECADRLRAEGRTLALIEAHGYDVEAGGPTAIHPDLRARIDGETVAVLVYGDRAIVSEVRGDWPEDDRRYLPEVEVAG